MKKLIIGLILLLAPLANAKAATMYFTPEQGELNVGDIFTVDVKIDLDSAEECINTIEGIVGFDSNYLAVEDFSTGDSFLSLWLEKPNAGDSEEINRQKRLKFSGGTPGGYCGKIPGDDGNSNIVGKIIFRVVNGSGDSPVKDKTKIFFYPDTQALLNDGFGTQAKLLLKEGLFSVAKTKGGQRQEWDKLKTIDNIPPESFTIEILKTPGIYEDKYYLVWNTSDKQTGVDHYEAQESLDQGRGQQSLNWWSSIKNLFSFKKSEAPWVTTKQPYIIHDQTLKSVIRIKAVDKAGNSQIAEYFPESENKKDYSYISKTGLIVILLLVIVYFLFRKKVLRKQ